MTGHSVCLKPTCRLCGISRAIPSDRSPYTKDAFKSVIKSCFCLDIDNDDPEIHPPFICYSCVQKLKRWKKGHSKDRSKVCNIVIAKFNDSQCASCMTDGEIPTNLHDYRKEAEKCSLVSLFPHEDELLIIRLSPTGDAVIKLTVNSDSTWGVVIAGVVLQAQPILGEVFNKKLPLHQFTKLCDILRSAKICAGNEDYLDLIERRKGPEGQIPIRITPKDVYLCNTIRHNDCELLIAEDLKRCAVCRIYRGDLSSMRSASCKEKSSLTVANKYLSNSQLQNKAATLQCNYRRLKRKSGSLENKVSKMYMLESKLISENAAHLMEDTMEMGKPEIESLLCKYPSAKLLWEQQLASMGKGKQMRWHPAILRWCIAIQSKSPSAYNLIRESGFMTLPHPNTLQPYSHFAGVTTGFCHEMLSRVVTDLKLYEEGNELQKHVVLLFDEMKIKSGLVFSQSSGKVVGSTDVGSLANEMHSFERRCRGEEEIPVASHVLVLMIRGLFSNLHVPIAYYPTTGASSCDLFMAMWEAVEMIEVAGFVVHAMVSDGATPNRKFYRLHSPSSTTSSIVFKTSHQGDPDRSVFFYSDVPHLIKTLRNNVENSGYNNKTRNLHYNKQDIKWSHFLDTYEWDVKLQNTCPGLRMLHKLTHEHLHLTPSLRMRVYLAAQVLSNSTANAMEIMDRHDMTSTIKFVRMVDQFFDCLNVSSFFQGKRSRKPAMEPYRTKDDWRFKWLQDDFLGFFKEWQDEVNALEDVEKSVKKRMLLSTATLDGLEITINSFVELTKKLLDLPGVECVLSAKYNQDPLEQYFSKQRGCGGSNTNPTSMQFGHNMHALYVAANCSKASRRGNCRSQIVDQTIDDSPLQRKKTPNA